MRIEDQVTDLEISKKLKALGVEQKSYFYWYNGWRGWTLVDIENSTAPTEKKEETVSAFTVAELGEMLPTNFKIFKYINDSWQYTEATTDWKDWREYKTEAEARAAMLIYLLEHNLTSLSEVNQKLK